MNQSKFFSTRHSPGTEFRFPLILFLWIIGLAAEGFGAENSPADLHVFGATDSIRNIDVEVVYYAPADVQPLADWQERIEYFMCRAEKFHQREWNGQSTLHYRISASPFIASVTRGRFPRDDVNHFYWHIIQEVWQSGKITFQTNAFPILLVMSDMNFSPSYDDWTRVCDGVGCVYPPPHSQCAGYVKENGEDRPGTRCGGARSVFWPEKHIGLGLVTADGWRIPLLGSDCVVYHEGIGHAIGLPHPEPIDNSVMGLAQYVDAIHKTWILEEQKKAMGRRPEPVDHASLFSTFDVAHDPPRPKSVNTVAVTASFPCRKRMKSITAEYQTRLREPFRSPGPGRSKTYKGITRVTWLIPAFPTGESVAYRVRIETETGEREEIWNYYKIR